MSAVLVGMNNPYSLSAENALLPSPAGCTGHNIWKMLNELTGATRSEYAKAFDRRNLVLGKFCATRARDAATAMTFPPGSVVVALGEEVRRAFDLPRQLIDPWEDEDRGVTWRQVPHPSGRNHFYNDPVQRRLVAMLLTELYQGEKQ